MGTSKTVTLTGATLIGVDAGNYVLDAVASATADITAVAAPDLVVTAVAGPATGTIGSTITISSTVANIGNAPAGSFRGGFYLVDAAFLADNTKGIKKYVCYRGITSLAESISTSGNSVCSVPSMPTGDYFLYAVADYLNAVNEGDHETNNFKTGSAITIFSVSPDLVIKSFTGTVENGQVSYTLVVKNQGNTAASAASYAGLYISTDATITSTDTFVNSVGCGIIAAGDEIVLPITGNVPLNLTAKDYYVGVILDYTKQVSEFDEYNNTRAVSHYIYNDLRSEVSGTVENGQVNYSVKVKNLGNGRATPYNGPLAMLYLSADATITSSDTYVASLGAPQQILVGGSEYTFTGTADVPVNVSGYYYVGAIADPGTAIPESLENNNATAGGQENIYNDLIVSAVSGTAANGEISYSVTVKNVGNGRANPYNIYLAKLYLSADAAITSSDSYVGGMVTSNILAGGSEYTFVGTANVPASIPAGDYYVGAIADPSYYIPESNEDNNWLAGNLVTR